MIEFSLSLEGPDTLEQIHHHLSELEWRVFDLMPLARQVGNAVKTDNMAARMLGVDADNDEFAPLAQATWDRHPERGPGPPLAGLGFGSGIINDMTIDIDDLGPGAVDVVGSWPNMPFLKYHVTGTRHMPRRNPVGLRVQAQDQIEQQFDEWLDTILGDTG